MAQIIKKKAQSVLKNNATASLTEMKLKSDSFIFSNEFTNTSGTGLSREFGSDFSKGLQQLPENTWTGPVKIRIWGSFSIYNEKANSKNT